MKFLRRKKEAGIPRKVNLEDLGRNLPSVPVELTEVSKRSRRQTLKLLVGGAAFLAAWPLLGKEARVNRLKELVGQEAANPDKLKARQAAKIIGQEILHTNIPHNNTAHSNIPHTDKHQNSHVNESKHVDYAPQGFEHTNTTIHVDTPVQTHVNVPHQDTPHTDVPHTNVEHVNRPGQENT
ncbi:MAG: hypothetical protein H5U07_03620 [Candidatus Aminicenantes bacterium]|nr:hypothetical protein [Candidatus Aminicenantes bacterium]